ncbi:SET domain-containing protein-lysine N-methyltransferase [bacterium]|nr:SET domain-containing protein-lysine N-methyltransferase [bacterium]
MVNKKILLIAGGVILADYLFAQINRPKIVYVDNRKNINASTIPPFGIYINKEQVDNELLLKHELVHWEQYKRTGAILFYIRYLAEKMIYGYDKMPLEIEARKKCNESDFCIDNYTECVRSGKALTVSNPNFRKENQSYIEGNKNWTISNSNIHGKGVFLNCDVPDKSIIDIAVGKFFIVTEFGSKINHSNSPNCELKELNDIFIVVSCKSIRKGEEITLNYDKNPNFLQYSEAHYK